MYVICREWYKSLATVELPETNFEQAFLCQWSAKCYKYFERSVWKAAEREAWCNEPETPAWADSKCNPSNCVIF